MQKAVTSLRLISPRRVVSSIRSASVAAQIVEQRLNQELESIRQAGTWKSERVISTSQSAHIQVEKSSNDLLNFCANNYLGLANNKEVIEAAKAALDQYGSGLSSVRFICGTQTIHKECKNVVFLPIPSEFAFAFSGTTHRSFSST